MGIFWHFVFSKSLYYCLLLEFSVLCLILISLFPYFLFSINIYGSPRCSMMRFTCSGVRFRDAFVYPRWKCRIFSATHLSIHLFSVRIALYYPKKSWMDLYLNRMVSWMNQGYPWARLNAFLLTLDLIELFFPNPIFNWISHLF